MTAAPEDPPLTALPPDAATAAGKVILHATTVCHAGKGLLILGPSGAGKSTLAMRMLALGARLIADDRSMVWRQEGQLCAACPAESIRGLLEVRGLGLLRVQSQDVCPLSLAVDLAAQEVQRLPYPREITICHTKLPLVLRLRNDHLAEALMLWLEQP